MAFFKGGFWLSVGPSLIFMFANVLALLCILRSNQKQKPTVKDKRFPKVTQAPQLKELNVSDVLGWEFEYARITASEAMAERHSIVNIYLLAAGVVLSGVAAVLSRETGLPVAAGTVLLWLLCGIGWIYFLAILRLRQAWAESAKAMNQIKDFYFWHASKFDADTVRTAFRWQTGTLPPPHKLWTVYFYSAMVIALLDSVAFVVGGMLLGAGKDFSMDPPTTWLLTALGGAFLLFHAWLYRAFLKPKPPAHPNPDPDSTEE